MHGNRTLQNNDKIQVIIVISVGLSLILAITSAITSLLRSKIYKAAAYEDFSKFSIVLRLGFLTGVLFVSFVILGLISHGFHKCCSSRQRSFTTDRKEPLYKQLYGVSILLFCSFLLSSYAIIIEKLCQRKGGLLTEDYISIVSLSLLLLAALGVHIFYVQTAFRKKTLTNRNSANISCITEDLLKLLEAYENSGSDKELFAEALKNYVPKNMDELAKLSYFSVIHIPSKEERLAFIRIICSNYDRYTHTAPENKHEKPTTKLAGSQLSQEQFTVHNQEVNTPSVV